MRPSSPWHVANALLLVLIACATPSADAIDCGRNAHACDHHRCLPQRFVCDGRVDCDDKSDEPAHCVRPTSCGKDEFQCAKSGLCLPVGYVCDGQYDCIVETNSTSSMEYDLSDESSAAQCRKKIEFCGPNEYQCNSVPECVRLDRFCDGVADCSDGSDEHYKCKQPITAQCKFGGTRVLGDDEVHCYCPDGQIPSGPLLEDCVYENVCNRTARGHAPPCDHICIDKGKAAFECLCQPGFQMTNGRCVPEFTSSDQVMFITDGGMRIATLPNISALNAATHVPLSSFVAGYDSIRKYYCWVKTGQFDGSSYMQCGSYRNGTIVIEHSRINSSFYLDGVNTMVHDFVNDNWFFADTQKSVIFACRADLTYLSRCRVILVDRNGHFADMAVDPVAGYIFYADGGSKRSGGIWRIDLNGSNRTSLYDRAIVLPKYLALVVDPSSRTVYFSDMYLNRVYAVDYDKRYPTRTILRSYGGLKKRLWISQLLFVPPYLWVVDKERVFQLDPLKNNNSAESSVYTEYASHTMSVVVANNYFHVVTPDFEESYDMCLTGITGHRICYCQDGLQFVNGACKDENPSTPLLIVTSAHPSSIIGLTLPMDSFNASTRLAMRSLYHVLAPSATAVDSANGEIIYCDVQQHSLFVRSVHDDDVRLLTNKDLFTVEGLAYDPTTKNIYYADAGLKAIAVILRSDPDKKKILIKSDLVNPRCVAVHQQKGYLFFSDWSAQVGRDGRIERCKSDGTQRKTLVTKNLRWPNGLAVDDDWLYWSDAYYNVIERVHFNGADREVVVSNNFVGTPFGVLIVGRFLFWAEAQSGQIHRATLRESGKNATDVLLVYDSGSTVLDIDVFNASATYPPSDCSAKNGGCEQFCFPMGCKGSVSCEPAKCGCADGYKTDPENRLKCIVDSDYKDPYACEERFQCRNRKCISKDQTCDGDDDCGDGSDEDLNTVCQNITTTCKGHLCDGTTCLEDKLLCNGVLDCRDATDESETICKGRQPRPCMKDMLRPCLTSPMCIPQDFICDGHRDCPEGDDGDERNCSSIVKEECDASEFRCWNNGAALARCIPLQSVCNGAKNCRDGSDEVLCERGCIPGKEFRCTENSPCISSKFQCDGFPDCPDGIDEGVEYCGNMTEHSVGCKGRNQFACADGHCIRSALVCDGVADCTEGLDEVCKTPNCNGTDFECSNKRQCIAKQLECDGHEDCDDGSDEHCSVALSRPCGPLDFKCPGTPPQECLFKEFVCDGIPHCAGGEDEHERYCALGKTACTTNLCQGSCHPRPTPNTFQCSCDDGWKLLSDGFTCEKDESKPCEFGRCSQLCTPRKHTSHCYCSDEYFLDSDQFTCRAVDPMRPFILFSNRHEIRRLPDDSLHAVPILSDMRNTIAIDYFTRPDNDTVTIFWTDIASDTINRAELTGTVATNVQTIVSTGIWTAEGLAVDWIGENIYWVDSYLDHIEVASMNGEWRATVLRGNMTNLRALALDPTAGLMFWTDWDDGFPRVESASMAGKDRKLVFNVSGVVNGGWPNGLTCDIVVKRIYWIDAKSDTVHTTDYNGGDHVVVLRDKGQLTHPFSIDLFENFVYWTDWRIAAVVRANKWNGTSLQIVSNTGSQPFYVKVVHRSKQPRPLRNPCQPNPCSYMCVISNNEKKFECICPNMFLTSKEGACTELSTVYLLATTSSLLAYHGEKPYRLALPVLGGAASELNSLDSYGDKILVVYSSLNALHVIETKRHSRVRKITLENSKMKSDRGIAVDRQTGAIYVAMMMDGKNGAQIQVTNLEGSFVRRILTSTTTPTVKRIKNLLFDDVTAQLFWFDDGYTPTALFTANADGARPRRVVLGVGSEHMDQATTAFIDSSNRRIMWFTTNNTLNYLHIDTKKFYTASLSRNISRYAMDFDADRGVLVYTKNHTIFNEVKLDLQSPEKIRDSVTVNMEDHLSASVTLHEVAHIHVMKTKLPKNVCPASCKALCLRKSASETICACPEPLLWANGQCQPPKFEVISAFARSIYSSSLESPLFVKMIYSSGPRVIDGILAVDNQRQMIYATTSNQLWALARNGTFASAVFNVSVSCVLPDEQTGNIVICAAQSLFLLDPMKPNSFTKLQKLESTNVVMDNSRGLLFWTNGTCLKRSNLDGSDTRCMLKRTSLVLDVDKKRKKVCLLEGKDIICYDYDGKNKQKVSTLDGDGIEFYIRGDRLVMVNSSYAKATTKIDVFDRNKDGMFSSKRSIGKMPDGIQAAISERTAVLFDDDSSASTNGCGTDNGGCQQFCTIKDSKPYCLCSHAERNTNGTCIGYSALVVYAAGSTIGFTPLPSAFTNQTVVDPINAITDDSIVRFSSAIVADANRYQLYFSDMKMKRITAVKYDLSKWFPVVESVGVVEGLAYDPQLRMLFYTRLDEPSIWKASVGEDDETSYPVEPIRVLTLSARERPRGIAVHPCYLTIFFTTVGQNPAIEKVFYSGFGRKRIIEEDLKNPNDVTIDFKANKLYFTDITKDKIQRSEFDGSGRESVVVSGDSPQNEVHPYAVAIHEDYLIFSDWKYRSITAVDKITGLGAFHLVMNLASQPMALSVSKEILDICESDPCRSANLGCTDDCRLSASGVPHCICNGERTLQRDNKTCSGSFATKKCAVNEFMCAFSERCIAYDETCDGVKDCPNGEDEAVDFCTNRVCRDGYFACGNGVCIPSSKRCDGVNQCINHADEINCACSSQQFRCSSGMCIAKAKRCDFHADCNDASDEMGCVERDCSKLTLFGMAGLQRCANTTQCIPAAWYCDGHDDCWDASDEDDCQTFITHTLAVAPKSCGEEQFVCNLTGSCLPSAWRCDGNQDCADGSDEKDCNATALCTTDQFQCHSNKQCIPKTKRCDGKRDCAMGEDEDHCDENCDTALSFRCLNNRCIPISWRCDGFNDCSDGVSGSDEVNCSSISMGDDILDIGKNFSHECSANRDAFTCGEKCIQLEWMCDGIKDCIDGSDEMTWNCNHFHCREDEFNCGEKCISTSKLCDGRANCLMGNDERACGIDECRLFSPCSDRCVDLPVGYRCECTPPKKVNPLDNSSCIFVDPCDHADCSQLCVSDGYEKHECLCDTGYQLRADGKSCKHIDAVEPELLIMTKDRLLLFSIEGDMRLTVVDNITNGVSLDYNIRKNQVFWTDFATPLQPKFGTVRLGATISNWKMLDNLKVKHPDGIAVDWLTEKLYFVDHQQKSISVATLEGRFQRVLLKGLPLRSPRRIAVDPIEKFVFWSDLGSPGAHLGRMWMDGSEPTMIVRDRIKWPSALTLDRAARRLYWADSEVDLIASCDYDGGSRRTVARLVTPYIFSLTVFEDYIYWTNWKNRTVIRAKKITGANRTVLISDELHSTPMGIKVLHPLMQNARQHVSHPCQRQAICENLCLIAENRDGFTCMCADGWRAVGKACVPDCKRYEVPCNSTYRCVSRLSVCDGIDDCGNSEDEFYFVRGRANSCPVATCKSSEVACSKLASLFLDAQPPTVDKCIRKRALCDGRVDCPLSVDENSLFCEDFECMENDFKCARSPKCIERTRVCDGRRDCDDNSDETLNCPCGKVTCANGGYCSAGRCICQPGYTGESCEKKACVDSCLNGGYCRKDIYGEELVYSENKTDYLYGCSCPLRYTGPHCEVDRCGLCSGHSTCRIDNNNNHIHCACDAGWTGDKCDQKVTNCTGFCFRGQCSIDNGELACDCERYYEGRRCESCQLESGVSWPCLNDGYCEDRSHCVCLPRYKGESCEIDKCSECPLGTRCDQKDPHEDIVCEPIAIENCDPGCEANGGTCYFQPPKSECLCPPRLKGRACNEQRSCEEFCSNGAKCNVVNETHFNCECPPGTFGARCQHTLCPTSRCENGGTCEIKNGSFTCNCPPGITGEYCTEMEESSTCSDNLCGNGMCVLQDNKRRCFCLFGWTGFTCSEPTCDNFCLNGGRCYINSAHDRAMCRCQEPYSGTRCERSPVDVFGGKSTSTHPLLMLPMLGVAMALTLFIIYKTLNKGSHGWTVNGAAGSGNHTYENEVFMVGEDGSTATPISEQTSFVNPVFESDAIYNDPVLPNGVELQPLTRDV